MTKHQKPARRPDGYTQRNRLPAHSNHSRLRCSQRGISDSVIDLIETHGTYVRAECGRWRRQLDYYQLYKLSRQGVDRNLLVDAVGVSVIVDVDETQRITAMHDTRPHMASCYESWRTLIRRIPSIIRKAA